MAAKTKKTPVRKGNSRLTEELLETAREMSASGLLIKAAHEKITTRHIDEAGPTVLKTLTDKGG